MTTAACSCLICAGETSGRDADIAETVRAHGWTVLWIAGGGLDFTYTVGLWHTFRRPEAVMFALDGEGMQHWLNAYVNHGRDHGWPAENEPFHGVIDGFATQLRPVHPSWHDALLGTADRFYRGANVPVQQLVWPDRNGRWHWEEQATASSRNRQAMAWLPVQEHPAGAWRLVGELGPDFPFPVGPDSWALTTRAVINGNRPIVRVARDEGSYDVLDERGYRADDLCLAFLGELVQRHPDIVAGADLSNGQMAIVGPEGAWSRSELSGRDRRDSKRSWKQAQPL